MCPTHSELRQNCLKIPSIWLIETLFAWTERWSILHRYGCTDYICTVLQTVSRCTLRKLCETEAHSDQTPDTYHTDPNKHDILLKKRQKRHISGENTRKWWTCAVGDCVLTGWVVRANFYFFIGCPITNCSSLSVVLSCSKDLAQ